MQKKCSTDSCAHVKCVVTEDGNVCRPAWNEFFYSIFYIITTNTLLHKTFLFISPDYSFMLSGKEITYVRERECDCDTPRDIISSLPFSFHGLLRKIHFSINVYSRVTPRHTHYMNLPFVHEDLWVCVLACMCMLNISYFLHFLYERIFSISHVDSIQTRKDEFCFEGWMRYFFKTHTILYFGKKIEESKIAFSHFLPFFSHQVIIPILHIQHSKTLKWNVCSTHQKDKFMKLSSIWNSSSRQTDKLVFHNHRSHSLFIQQIPKSHDFEVYAYNVDMDL